MSINMTTHGSHKCKMVTYDPDTEFNRRRKIRLQQVRQQSKEIAADVRNRVREEKEKQLSKAEQNGENELKRYQARKLHTLQKHYDDCRYETGAAHTNATVEQNPADVLKNLAKKNDRKVKLRGRIANETQAKEANRRTVVKELSNDQRKQIRNIENKRASMVSQIRNGCQRVNTHSNKKRKKPINEMDSDDFCNSDIENISNISGSDSSPRRNKPAYNVNKKPNYFHNDIRKPNKTHVSRSEIPQRKFVQSSPSPNKTKAYTSQKQKAPPPRSRPPQRHTCFMKQNMSPQKASQEKRTKCPQKFNAINDNEYSSSNDEPISYLELDPNFVLSPLPSDRSIFPEATPRRSPKKSVSPLITRTNKHDPPSPLRFESPSPTRIRKQNSPAAMFVEADPRKMSPGKVRKLIEDHRPTDKYQPIDKYRPIDFCKSTKIADRIRQRELSEPISHQDDYSTENLDNFQLKDIVPESKSDLKSAYESKKLKMENIHIVSIPAEKLEVNLRKVTASPKPIAQLPYVPTTTLKPDNILKTKISETQGSKVKYYDHSNHFSKQYNPSPLVQKIDKESIKVQLPTEQTEKTDFFQNMNKQDKMAQIRGNKAMEKSRIQQDYKQLMEELPALQRQERLAAMRNHNPTFHMNDDRLNELERRRQNRIENIFEKYYYKSKTLETPLITIRPVQKPPPTDEMKLPFTALDVTEDSQLLNVGQWKSEDQIQTVQSNRINTCRQAGDHSQLQKPNTVNKVSPSGDQSQKQNEMKQSSPEDSVQCKQKCLSELLERLNKQRDILLQEVQNLQRNENVADQSKKPSSKCAKIKKVATATGSVGVGTTTKKPKSKKDDKKHEKDDKNRETGTSSDSSEDKKKKRPKQKWKKQKINKNEATQTSPLLVKEMRHVKEKPISTEESSDKLCEIIIKMKDDSNVKICTQTKSTCNLISTEPAVSKYPQINDEKPKSFLKPKQQHITKKSPVRNDILCSPKPFLKPKQQQTTKKSPVTNDFSSSTSYMSPPVMHSVPNTTSTFQNQDSGLFYRDILYTKPKQTNIDIICGHRTKEAPNKKCNCDSKNKQKTKDKLLNDCSYGCKYNPNQKCTCIPVNNQNIDKSSSTKKEITPKLSNYIQKLLCMSRRSIDELTVSSVSEVSSPGVIVVDTIENNPFIQLQNVMNYYNLSFQDIQQHFALSDSSNSSNSQILPTNQSHQNKSVPCASTNETKTPKHHQSTSGTASTDLEYMCDVPYTDILLNYQEVTKNCVDKISKLTTMIDKIRSEKEPLLSPISTDMNENSTTSYLDLPSQRNQNCQKINSSVPDGNENKTHKSYNSNESHKSTLTQEEVDRYLLEIETNKFGNDRPDHVNSSKTNTPETFIPMLQGIPKFCDQLMSSKAYVDSSPHPQQYLSMKTKPPASLVQNVHRYNLNIDMTPHELSTIVELDTLTSSRNMSEIFMQRPNTPEDKTPGRDVQTCTEETFLSNSGFLTISPEYSSPGQRNTFHQQIKTKSFSTSKDKKVSKKSSPDKKGSGSDLQVSGVLRLSSGSDHTSSSPENMEAILRNMGLGWAVSTLKKTQEALALSSSSSSMETSIRKRINLKEATVSSSVSDVSLKDVLSKEFLKKLSSTSLSLSNSSTDMSPRFQELYDVSEIIGGTGTQSRDRSAQRTSTPVHQSKSTDSKNNLFASESDVSSVKHNSDENFFLSIPNVSLDTNRSLNKSKK